MLDNDLDLLDSAVASTNVDNILEGLNEAQNEAVTAPRCNMLIIAGAGTGKTRVLVSRIAYLISHEHIYPRNILAVTFTNKAANEMRERIGGLVGHEVQRQLWASTFHSICLRLLRAYAQYTNLSPNFTVLDTDNQNSLVKRIIKDLGIDDKELKASSVVSKISKLKEKGIRATEYAQIGRNEEKYSEISQIYSNYERICNEENAVDFSELLLRTVELLSQNKDICLLQHKRFKEILVDEFQDTNSIQYKFLRLIAGPDAHVMVVGDDDQSIYGWRGADYTNMGRFLKEFSDVKQVLLAQNYRSSQKILDMANTLIAENEERLMEKVLKGNLGNGETVQIVKCANSYVEPSAICKMIKELHLKGEKYSDIAILYRNNYLSLGFEQNLPSYQIPYVIYGGQKFFERAEILDALAYMRVLVNEDDDTATLRIINVPARKIGPKVIGDLRAIARERQCSIIKAIKLLHNFIQEGGKDKHLSSLYKKVAPFYALIDSLLALKNNVSLEQFVDGLLSQTGLYDYYSTKDAKEGKSGEEHSRLNNLGVLVSNVKDFEQTIARQATNNILDGDVVLDGLAENNDPLLTYLSNVTLVSTGEINEDGADSTSVDAVNMMTIHASKGLEFKYVFLVGFESNIIPSRMATNELTSKKGLEEERRLAYVGITRAKSELYISYALERNIFGQSQAAGASLFLRDIVNKYKGQKEKPYVIVPIANI